MARKNLKRLDLWLPDNHPIWSLPPRTRAPIARSCLDLLTVSREMSQKLEEILRRLEVIERSLSFGAPPVARQDGRDFDAAGFFAAFD